jgi:hypothetical protein
MKTAACLAVCALGSAQAFSPPRIELDMSAMESFSSCGSSCSTGPHSDGATQPNGAAVMRRQDYVYTCKADSDTCALPSAKAWDHNEGELTVTKRVFLADIDNAPVNPAVLQVGGAIDRSKRSKYLIYYDAQDAAGNHAEQVVLELILNDEEKPSITVCQNSNINVQAGDPGCLGADFKMCKSTAKDNIDGDLTNVLKYTIARPDGQLLVTDATYATASAALKSAAINTAAGVSQTTGVFTVNLQVQDTAGYYGASGQNNAQTDTFAVTFEDTKKPVLSCNGDGCTGDAPATAGFGATVADVHECATAFSDAAVGGVTAADCLDDLTSTTLAITSDISDIKTGAPNSWPNVAAKTDTTPYYVKFDVSDRSANAADTVYRKVVVTDTTAPVSALIQPELTQITHQSKEGNALTDPGATCADTCDQAIAAPVETWTSILPNDAGHAGCTEDNVDGTIVWSCDKRAQKHGAWDGKKVGEYIRTYTCTDASGNTHSSQRKFIVVDNDQPVITIVGSEDLTYEATHDSVYEDAGATCSDYTNGQLANAVVVSSWNNKDSGTPLDVDFTTTGTYTVEYNCQDLQGNDAASVQRSIKVQDTTCPVVAIQGANLLYIEAGFPYVDAGATASDTLDGDITSKIWKEGDTVDEDTAHYERNSCEDIRLHAKNGVVPSTGNYMITPNGSTRIQVRCDFHSHPTKAFTFYPVTGSSPVNAYSAGVDGDCTSLGMWMYKSLPDLSNCAAANYYCKALKSASDALGSQYFQATTTNLYTCATQKVKGEWDKVKSVSRHFKADDKTLNSRVSSEAGMYIISYHVSDINSNRECATSLNKRTVVVKDTLPPVISLHLGKDAAINMDQINALSDVGLNGIANPAAGSANPVLANEPDYVVQPNSFPLYANREEDRKSLFMAETTASTSNAWIVAGVASAVTGLALLGMSSRRSTVVEV